MPQCVEGCMEVMKWPHPVCKEEIPLTHLKVPSITHVSVSETEACGPGHHVAAAVVCLIATQASWTHVHFVVIVSCC